MSETFTFITIYYWFSDRFYESRRITCCNGFFKSVALPRPRLFVMKTPTIMLAIAFCYSCFLFDSQEYNLNGKNRECFSRESCKIVARSYSKLHPTNPIKLNPNVIFSAGTTAQIG